MRFRAYQEEILLLFWKAKQKQKHKGNGKRETGNGKRETKSTKKY